MIRICLVEDHTIVRQGLRGLLDTQPELQVVAEAADAEGAVGAVLEYRPDVLLLDVWLGVSSGLDAVEALRALSRLPPTVLLSSYEDPQVLALARTAGVIGYLTKDVPFSVLVEAVWAAAAGRPVARSLLNEAARGQVAARRAPVLNRPDLLARELEVLGLLASGQSTREVARSLNLREGTVKNYLSSAMAKLEARDRTGAVLRALQLGLL